MQRKVIALRALNDAADFLKKQFRSTQRTNKKDDGTLVSSADYGSEKRIIGALQKAFPDDAILSEERGAIAGTSGYRWILDPLDGTHNFLARIPIFGILLALEKKEGIIMSFCAFPMIDEVFIAEKGEGAYLNGKRIRVSKASSLENSVFLADGNTHMDFHDIVEDVRPFHAKGYRFRFLGEGPFGMTRVALGTVQAAILRCGKVWDYAAPALLVEEAGGKVTDLEGYPWNLEPHPLLASSGSLHKKILSMVSQNNSLLKD